jgi:hypothetical protein
MARGDAKKARRKEAKARRTSQRAKARRKIEEARQRAAQRRAAAQGLYRKLASFFRAAGVVTALKSGSVEVNGRRLCQLLSLNRVKDWDQFLNRVAAGYCSKQFVAALLRNLHAAGAQAFYDRDLHGFRIEKDGRDVAAVWAAGGRTAG